MFCRIYGLDSPIHPPTTIALTPIAQKAWFDFCGRHADEQETLSGYQAAVWSKLRSYCARLALVLHLVRAATDDPRLDDPNEVDCGSVRDAEQLVRWFKSQAERVEAIGK